MEKIRTSLSILLHKDKSGTAFRAIKLWVLLCQS